MVYPNSPSAAEVAVVLEEENGVLVQTIEDSEVWEQPPLLNRC